MNNEQIFNFLMKIYEMAMYDVRFQPLQASHARIRGSRIAVRFGEDLAATNYELCHEMAHAILHRDRDLIADPDQQAEEEADNLARHILDALRFNAE